MFDTSGLEKALQNLEEVQQDIENFCEQCAKELTARLLRKVIKRTPVGVYPKRSGKKGGTLRRAWTGGKGVMDFVSGTTIEKEGNLYRITIENNATAEGHVGNHMSYASFVEFGHRTRGGRGWVRGKFMLTLSEEEIQRDAPAILEKKIKKRLEGLFL